MKWLHFVKPEFITFTFMHCNVRYRAPGVMNYGSQHIPFHHCMLCFHSPKHVMLILYTWWFLSPHPSTGSTLLDRVRVVLLSTIEEAEEAEGEERGEPVGDEGRVGEEHQRTEIG